VAVAKALPALLISMGVTPRGHGGTRSRSTSSRRKGDPPKGMEVSTKRKEKGPEERTAKIMAKTPRRADAKIKKGTDMAPSQQTGGSALEPPWTLVISKVAKKRAATRDTANQGGRTAPTGGLPLPKTNQGKKGKGGNTQRGEKASQGRTKLPEGLRAPRIRPPTTAAVSVTCADSGSYAEVLRTAKKKIELKSLGIEDLRPRRAITGALVLEIRGEGNGEKADALANKLREIMADRDDVKISRPIKTVEIRLSGLDDSVTPQEVAEALGRVGGCTPQEIKVGDVRQALNGLGTCWLRCPARAGKAVLAAPRIRVGWSICKATLLPPRGLQCFRCLASGHVQAKCSSRVDRSGCCYKCGAIGHQARECKEKVGCPVCRDKGKPADHRLGGKGCSANKPERVPPSRPVVNAVAKAGTNGATIGVVKKVLGATKKAPDTRDEVRRDGGRGKLNTSLNLTRTPTSTQEESPLPQRERRKRDDSAQRMEVEEPQEPENAP
jgi:hypothetical protein